MALFNFPYATIFDTSGNLEPGAKAYFYIAGTSTPLDTYSDADLMTANTNPVIADGAGALGPIYLKPQSYKIIVKDANDSTIKTVDEYAPIPSGEQILWAGTVGGTADAVLLTTDPLVQSLRDGTMFWWRSASANTAAMTINLDGTGAKALVWPDGTAMLVGDVPALAIVLMSFDAVNNRYNILSGTAGPLFRTQLNADIIQTSTGNLTFNRPVSASKTTNYTILSTDRNKVILYNISAAANAAFPDASTLANGYEIDIISLYASTADVTFTKAAGNGFYSAFASNAATFTLSPGWSATVKSNGGSWFVTGVSRGIPDVVQGGVNSLKIATTDAGVASVITCNQIALQDTSNNSRLFTTVSVTATLSGAGANGLDTGSIAVATWYSLWVIARYDGTVAALASLSATAPTMPSGYVFKARVGWVRTKSGAANFLGTIQYGRDAQYTATPPPNLDSGAKGSTTIPTWTSAAVANFIPTTASRIMGHLSVPTGGAIGMCAPNNSYAAYNAASNRPPVSVSFSGLAGGSASAPFNFVIESTNIFWAAGGATSELVCTGWVDNL